MSKNSRKVTPPGTLAPISAAKAKNFLRELANLLDDAAAVQRFKARFESVFLPEVPWEKVQQWAFECEQEAYPELSKDDCLWEYWLMPLRDTVRVIWGATDPRRKQWGIFRILEKYFAMGDRSLAAGPLTEDFECFLGTFGPATPCEHLFQYLNGRTLHCGNPECPAPYFWAVRKSQKYCSETCSRPAQRGFKRNWWAKHGKDWRNAQAAERKQQRRNRRRKR